MSQPAIFNGADVGSPVSSFAELLQRMSAIDQALPVADGVACFNHMYLAFLESPIVVDRTNLRSKSVPSGSA